MKKKYAIFVMLILLGLSVFAQTPGTKNDKLFKVDNTVIDCKIIEVSDLEIKYKKANYLDGPTYSIAKKDIVTILYANGESEVISVQPPSRPNTNQPAPPTQTGASSSSVPAATSQSTSTVNSSRPTAISGNSLENFYGESSLFVEAGYLPTVKSSFIPGSASGLELKASFLINNFVDSEVVSLISYGATAGYSFASGRITTGGDLTYTQIPVMGSFRAYFVKYLYLQPDIGLNITKAEFEDLTSFIESKSAARLIYGLNAGYVLDNFTIGASYHLSSWKDLATSFSLNTFSVKVGYKF